MKHLLVFLSLSILLTGLSVMFVPLPAHAQTCNPAVQQCK